MKKILSVLALIMSAMSFAQTNQLVWSNGRFMYGTPIENIDSLTFGEVLESDTMLFIMPRTVVMHDTVYVNNPTTDQNECPCSVDKSQIYAEKLVGKWKNWDGDFWGEKIYTFNGDNTGYESGYGNEKEMSFKWQVEKHNANYYIHVIDWTWDSDTKANIYWQVEFMTDDIIVMTGIGTEDGTFERIFQ